MKNKKLILTLLMFFSCFNQVHGMKSSSSSSANKNNESKELKFGTNSLIQHKCHRPLNLNSKNYMSEYKKDKNSKANRNAIAKYVEDNSAKFSKITNPEKYLKDKETLKDLETKNAYYIKADKNLEDTLRGLLNAIIPDAEEYPDGKNKKEVLDKYTCKLRDWCLASMNPLHEKTFQKLKKEYLKFAGKNYRNEPGAKARAKAGKALQDEHIQDFKYLPASSYSFARTNNIKGVCNNSILFNTKTDKYEVNVTQDLRYRNDNILIESRAICEGDPKIYGFYENDLAQIRLVIFYKHDNSASPRVFISFDHYNKNGIIFEIQSRFG